MTRASHRVRETLLTDRDLFKCVQWHEGAVGFEDTVYVRQDFLIASSNGLLVAWMYEQAFVEII
jgi:hypothetical protein